MPKTDEVKAAAEKRIAELEEESEAAREDLARITKERDSERAEVEKLHDARLATEKERDAARAALAALQARWARLARELGAGGDSPLDWDKAGKGDPVEYVLSALKSRDVSGLSIRTAHEKLRREHDQVLERLAAAEAWCGRVRALLEGRGLAPGTSQAEAERFLAEWLAHRDPPPASDASSSEPVVRTTRGGTRIEIHVHAP